MLSNIKILTVKIISLSFICVINAVSYAQTNELTPVLSRKYCWKWATQYIDSKDDKEDIYNNEGIVPREARYARYKLSYCDSFADLDSCQEEDNVIKRGYLDANGCTEYLDVNNASVIRMKVFAQNKNDAKRFIVRDVPDNDGHQHLKTFNIYLETLCKDNWVDIPYTTPCERDARVDLYWETPNYWANLSTIAGLLLQKENDFLSDDDKWSQTEFRYCGGELNTQWLGIEAGTNYQNICVMNTPETAHAYYKFTVTHELGHGIGASFGFDQWYCESYAFRSNTELLHCPEGAKGNEYDGCLQSLEVWSSSVVQSWAYLVAYALYNHRHDENDNGYFSYYRRIKKYENGQMVVKEPPNLIDLKEKVKWAVTNGYELDSDMDNVKKATFWDYSLFYYNLWQDRSDGVGDETFNVKNMAQIWAESYDRYENDPDQEYRPYYWTYVWDAVMDMVGEDEEEAFKEQARSCGVATENTF